MIQLQHANVRLYSNCINFSNVAVGLKCGGKFVMEEANDISLLAELLLCCRDAATTSTNTNTNTNTQIGIMIDDAAFDVSRICTRVVRSPVSDLSLSNKSSELGERVV